MADTAQRGPWSPSPPSEPGRNPTEPDTLPALPPRQRRAAEAVALGASKAEAARMVGVRRQTVSGWSGSPAFVAYVAAVQAEAVASVRRRLLALSDEASAAVLGAVRSGDLNAALRVLPHLIGPMLTAHAAEAAAADTEARRIRVAREREEVVEALPAAREAS